VDAIAASIPDGATFEEPKSPIAARDLASEGESDVRDQAPPPEALSDGGLGRVELHAHADGARLEGLAGERARRRELAVLADLDVEGVEEARDGEPLAAKEHLRLALVSNPG